MTNVAEFPEQPAMAPGSNFREAESAESPVDDDLFGAVLADTVAALGGEEVPYIVMGGIGAATHGRPRWTHDIDVLSGRKTPGAPSRRWPKPGFVPSRRIPTGCTRRSSTR